MPHEYKRSMKAAKRISYFSFVPLFDEKQKKPDIYFDIVLLGSKVRLAIFTFTSDSLPIFATESKSAIQNRYK